MGRERRIGGQEPRAPGGERAQRLLLQDRFGLSHPSFRRLKSLSCTVRNLRRRNRAPVLTSTVTCFR